jgi:hypothetical protein
MFNMCHCLTLSRQRCRIRLQGSAVQDSAQNSPAQAALHRHSCDCHVSDSGAGSCLAQGQVQHQLTAVSRPGKGPLMQCCTATCCYHGMQCRLGSYTKLVNVGIFRPQEGLPVADAAVHASAPASALQLPQVQMLMPNGCASTRSECNTQ